MRMSVVLPVLRPGALWRAGEDTYETLEWLDDATEQPSRAECEAEWAVQVVLLAWVPVRRKRDRLLAACDWTQVADAPVDAAAWAAYRQALRDVPQNFASPDEVVWPTAP